MTLPPALNLVQNYGAVATMAANSVDTMFVFNLLDALNGLIAQLNTVKNTAGLDAYATEQVPGYSGTMSADIQATINAAQACIDWVVANFPASGGFLQAFSLNVDGTRVMRTFSPAQTAGFRTALNNLLATIG